MDERFTELEIRLTHLEDTLDILNHSVIEQRDEIDRLKHQIEALEKRLKAQSESLIAKQSEETPPPHY